MRTATLCLTGILLGLATHTEPLSVGAVGVHPLRVVNEGQPYCLVSIPLLKMARARGRLDGVDPATRVVTDTQGAFGQLDAAQRYILLVRSGPAKGAWFVVEPPADGAAYADTPTTLTVEEADATASLADLNGDDVFAAHPLFSLAELFPPSGGLLPAGRTDVVAGQILFPEGGDHFRKYWLSDGTLTTEPGWTVTEADGAATLMDVHILPGASFFVCHPDPTENIDVMIHGEVPDIMLRKSVHPGYNFLAAEYNLSRTGLDGKPSFQLQDLRLAISGFRYGATSDDVDWLYRWDTAAADYTRGRWLQDGGTTLDWLTDDDPPTAANQEQVAPGEGLIIWNGGEDFVWGDGE